MAALRSPELLTVAQMRQADAAAIAAGVGFDALMDNAGTAVAGEVMRRWAPQPSLVLCGPGNNGGDGLVIARTLKAAGWPVRVALAVPRTCLAAALEGQARQWSGTFETLQPELLAGNSLIIDALFGAGLNRPLDGAVAALLQAVSARGLPVVAVDVPSGLDGDTGRASGAIAAALTVTFFRRKPGHLLADGPALCGNTVVADIGIPDSVLGQLSVDTWENAPALWDGTLRLPAHGRHAPSAATGWEVLADVGVDDPLAVAREISRGSGKLAVINASRVILAEPGGLAVVDTRRRAGCPESWLQAALANALERDRAGMLDMPLWQRLCNALWSLSSPA